MKVKKYVAANMNEALALIKADLGQDAYILSSQMVKQKGMLKFFKAKQLEVTAAIEHHPHSRSIKESRGGLTRSTKGTDLHQPHPSYYERSLPQMNKWGEETDNVKTEQLIAAVLETVEKNNQDTFNPIAFQKVAPLQNEKTVYNDSDKFLVLEQQMKQMQEKMEQLVSQPVTPIVPSHSNHKNDEHHLANDMATFLKDYDFSDQFEKEFLKYMMQQPVQPTTVTRHLLETFLTQEIDYRVVINEAPLSKVNIFVGPPGVGKTTTIAKIASNEILKSNRKIGLITVDTYRIGAVEQLKTYANILNVPLKIVYSVEDMKQALKELDYCDCIIVDSMGRTHKDQENLEELQQLFSSIETKKILLVLSMSSKYRQLKKMIDNYRILSYDHLLLTKLDESDRNENLINICYDTQKSMTYLCTGQEVPNDMMIATKPYIISSILGGETSA